MRRAWKERLPEWLTAGAALVYYWIMALYKLTQAPIWQDEAMEFYCSLPIQGPIRGVTTYATMYERMVRIQQQPPLYNWLMCLWLQAGEGEWWFRFSSVVFGFLAAVGLYFVIRKLCDRWMAAFCVVIYSSIYILMYYIKEASEYALLVMLLFWLLYVWILLCERRTATRVVLFTVLCTLSVFTHYGAVFVVVPFGVSVLVSTLAAKERQSFWTALGSFAVAGGVGGAVLVCLFIIPQSANQVSTLFSEKEIIIERGGILDDFLNSLMWVFKWCTIDMDRDWEKIWGLIIAAMIVIAAVIVFVAVKSRRRVLRTYLYCNIAVYLLYYIITKLNIYAYGWYGNRYNMFLLPLWFVLIAASLYELVMILRRSSHAAVSHVLSPQGFCTVFMAITASTVTGRRWICARWFGSGTRGMGMRFRRCSIFTSGTGLCTTLHMMRSTRNPSGKSCAIMTRWRHTLRRTHRHGRRIWKKCMNSNCQMNSIW